MAAIGVSQCLSNASRFLAIFKEIKTNKMYSSSTLNSRPRWVTLTDDGRTIVCWHPEQEFPYECTQPLPVEDQKLCEGDSVLKIQHRLEDLDRNQRDGPNRIELQAMTFTTKHQWFPHRGIRYRKKNPPIDRDGL